MGTTHIFLPSLLIFQEHCRAKITWLQPKISKHANSKEIKTSLPKNPPLLFTSPASALQRLKLFIHRKALQEPRWGKLGSTFRGPAAHLARGSGCKTLPSPQKCRNLLALNFTETLPALVSIYTSLATGSAVFKKTTKQQNFHQTFLFPSPLPPCEVMAT